jgi:hypothetical protein
MSGGAFSLTSAPSYLDLCITKGASLPGSGQYNTATAAPSKGGRISATSAPSDTEMQMRRAAAMPGPSDYDVRAADRQRFASEHTGKFPFVWRPTDPKYASLAKGASMEPSSPKGPKQLRRAASAVS